MTAGDSEPRPTTSTSNGAPAANGVVPSGAVIGSSSSSLAPPQAHRRDPGLRLGGFTQLQTDVPDSDDSADEEGNWRTPKGPMTPNIAETAQQLRRSLSVHGLHELANMPASTLRSKVWRPQDEEARIPSDWERLAVHVVKGGIRSWLFTLSFRGTVMILFALIKAFRSK